MKVLILCLIGLTLSYNADEAVNYAYRWYDSFNPAYNTYGNTDCANFVSQCLIAGGQTLSGCIVDDKGCVTGASNLGTCLIQKGWKSSSNMPSGFRAGYPIIFPGHATICSSIQNGQALVACHSKPHYDVPTSWYGTPTYYYP